MANTILVTGGAGYIGSHTCVELIQSGYDVVIVDNLCNSSSESLNRVSQITGSEIPFHNIDIRDSAGISKLLKQYNVTAVIHFAGLKAVGESVEMPLSYYDNNVCGTVELCKTLDHHGVNRIIFSSSATVYGDPASVPISEDFPLSTTNPYGASKLMVENILRDTVAAHAAGANPWQIILLRYFNPVGAHESGLIGEDPQGVPNNLMPYVTQVASGKLKELAVFGDDYSTPDGTGVRDYIHVVDLAKGHVKALDKLLKTDPSAANCEVFNLGTGNGFSVLEMIKAFEEQTGNTVAYKIVERRSGDIAECYADPKLAQDELQWTAQLGLNDMVKDAWTWQKNNPKGYDK